MKLGELANITTGQMVKRKEAIPGEISCREYRMLTLKSFDAGGYLIEEKLDVFHSAEEIDEKYITQEGDVIVRLSSPYTSVTIDKQSVGLLIPSLFVVIRRKNRKILPEYISVYLNSECMKKTYAKETSGSAIQIIKTSAFKEFELNIPDLRTQEKVVALNQLMLKEKKLLRELIEQIELKNAAVLTNILCGGRDNGY
ncbi:MAG: restriction endonuclease subunit S [Bacillota bacterium]